MSQTAQSSVLFSLNELMAAEEERQLQEERARRRQDEVRSAQKEKALAVVRRAEEARLAEQEQAQAERERARRAEQAQLLSMKEAAVARAIEEAKLENARVLAERAEAFERELSEKRRQSKVGVYRTAALGLGCVLLLSAAAAVGLSLQQKSNQRSLLLAERAEAGARLDAAKRQLLLAEDALREEREARARLTHESLSRAPELETPPAKSRPSNPSQQRLPPRPPSVERVATPCMDGDPMCADLGRR